MGNSRSNKDFLTNCACVEERKVLEDNKLGSAISRIIEQERRYILGKYYEEYCKYISKFDKKKRKLEELRNICLPLKKRFGLILDRFITVLRTGSMKYDLSESEYDEEYALRFVVPGSHKKLDSHDIIKMTESLYRITSAVILTKLDLKQFCISKDKIMVLMTKLIYISFEDLWVSSVVGFRSQQSSIQNLLRRLMSTQEKERQNLWREIHDELLQVLGVIPIKLAIAEELSSVNPKSMRDELTSIRSEIERTIETIRSFSHGFNLFWVERKGFVFSLNQFINRFQQEFDITVTVRTSPCAKKFNGYPGLNLFRMIQEALYNVAKHSGASNANVEVELLDKEVIIIVTDNGKGFDPKLVRSTNRELNHLGLMSMKQRASILNGYVKVEPRRNKGTRVRICIPLKSLSISSKLKNRELEDLGCFTK